MTYEPYECEINMLIDNTKEKKSNNTLQLNLSHLRNNYNLKL